MSSKLRWIAGYKSIFILAAGLRLIALGSAPYWYDESFTVLLTRLPFGRMIAATAGDTHPPLWYILEWLWAKGFGESEFSLRLPAAIFGVVALWLFWRLVKALRLPEPVQIGAVVLMAVSPFQVYYSQEARMYTLLLCLVEWAVLAVLERRWIQLGLATAGLLWTHNYGLIYAAVIGLFVLYREHKALVKPVISMAIAGLSFSPWLFVLAGQMKTVASGYWIQQVTAGEVLMGLISLWWADSPLWMSTMAGMLIYGGLLWAVIRMARRRKAWGILWLGLAPIVLAILISVTWRPVWLFRGLVGVTPFLTILLAWPVMIQTQRRRLFAAVLVVPLVVGGLLNHYVNNPKNAPGQQITDLITMLRDNWQPGDIIYMANDGPVPALSVYAPDLAPAIYELPECPDAHTLGALSPATRSALGYRQMPLDQLQYNRVWVIWVWASMTSQCEVEQMQALVSGHDPLVILEDNEFTYAGIYRWTNPYTLARP